MLLVGAKEVCDEATLGPGATECLVLQLLDRLKCFLTARILERGKIADEHRYLEHLGGIGISHPFGRAIRIEAHAPLFAPVVEGLLVGVGTEFVPRSEFMNELAGVIAGRLPPERRRQHEPRTILLSQRIHGLRVARCRREPGSGKPTVGGGGERGERQRNGQCHEPSVACGETGHHGSDSKAGLPVGGGTVATAGRGCQTESVPGKAAQRTAAEGAQRMAQAGETRKNGERHPASQPISVWFTTWSLARGSLGYGAGSTTAGPVPMA